MLINSRRAILNSWGQKYFAAEAAWIEEELLGADETDVDVDEMEVDEVDGYGLRERDEFCR